METVNIIESLCDVVENEGLKLEDRLAFGQCLYEAMMEGNFKYLEKDGKQVGWVCWQPWGTDEGTAVFVHSLLILKKHGIYPLHRIVTFFRNKYDDLYKIYWHSYRKDKRIEFLIPKRNNL